MEGHEGGAEQLIEPKFSVSNRLMRESQAAANQPPPPSSTEKKTKNRPAGGLNLKVES